MQCFSSAENNNNPIMDYSTKVPQQLLQITKDKQKTLDSKKPYDMVFDLIFKKKVNSRVKKSMFE